MKKCIFCGGDTSHSKSIEHIIPESLGNTEFVLEKGIVCDKCNNYFARKVEQPFFDIYGIRNLLFYKGIENKKGNISINDAQICGDRCSLSFKNNQMFLEVDPLTLLKIIEKKPSALLTRGYPKLSDLENNYVISRFLLKAGHEFVMSNILEYYKKQNIDDFELYLNTNDEMIKYVRYGDRNKHVWPYYVTASQVQVKLFSNKKEYISLESKVDKDNIYFIFSYMSYKFAINLCSREIESFLKLK